ncbi:MAG: hypothetical protein ABI724_13315 [Betaproteobacteria bacterium]
MEPPRLVRPATVRLLWRAFIALLALTVIAGFFVSHEHPDGPESGFAFGAWFGFGACAALIAAAKVLAVFLKRPDTYYEFERRDD